MRFKKGDRVWLGGQSDAQKHGWAIFDGKKILGPCGYIYELNGIEGWLATFRPEHYNWACMLEQIIADGSWRLSR